MWKTLKEIMTVEDGGFLFRKNGKVWLDVKNKHIAATIGAGVGIVLFFIFKAFWAI